MKQHFVTCWKLQKTMEVETVVENPDGDFKMPKKAVKRKIAEAEKVTFSYKDLFTFKLSRKLSWTLNLTLAYLMLTQWYPVSLLHSGLLFHPSRKRNLLMALRYHLSKI